MTIMRISTAATRRTPLQKPSLKIPSITEQEDKRKVVDSNKRNVYFFMLFKEIWI